jgi:superfamily II DNA/RNA helicase
MIATKVDEREIKKVHDPENLGVTSDKVTEYWIEVENEKEEQALLEFLKDWI